MQVFKADSCEIHYGHGGNAAGPALLWAHGWGQSGVAFAPLSQSFDALGEHIFIDFPGFGASPPPPEAWATADYADEMAGFIRGLNLGPVVWIGHSFGCRVGLQIAARHPDLVKGLFLIAAAGLPRKRPLHQKLYLKFRVALYKALKKCIPLGLSEDWLKSKFGAPDYKNAAGVMRNVFVKTVTEDLSDIAVQIRCPVMLVYGADDTETPPEIGRRLNALIKNSAFVELPGQDHYSVLGAGRHQVAPHLKTFIGGMHG